MASQDGGRTVALSRQLSLAHDELRRRINDLKNDLDAGAAQRRSDGETLLAHCLAFCTALETHHRGEDEGLFAQLVRERPDLAGTVAKLVEDHGLISSILTRVAELARQAAATGGGPGPDEAVRRELDGLAAIMESHFRYEERTISEALDRTVPDDDWPEPVLRLRAPSPGQRPPGGA
ncbi:hemerythrin domain-containing protein [Kitasatospora purpeofusca]|uniref:hemerythrin domain-containing protein n=1 Tax=Kitasatospora purpeofusca TaxID=67352 RepID=UPI00224FC66B|nr:hemerythrin domain-containing protein [Kitasatospora purpeofusca]MCX4690208.1 hemerythrin domain-containing protein [Kitasatospora purpeofusca]